MKIIRCYAATANAVKVQNVIHDLLFAKDLFTDNIQTPSQVANKKTHLMYGIHQP